jgi:hypothetical protein
MHIPDWMKWLAVAGVIIWLITDAKGMGQFIKALFNGVVTVFETIG